MMNGAFLTFAKYHGKDVGSSRIRAEWVMKHWPEELGTVEEFQQGKQYGFVIYQKVYWPKHAESYEGVKILDMCDADWYDWEYPFAEMLQHMDAVTTSTEKLAEAIREIIDGLVQHGDLEEPIPVIWIDDRMCPEFHYLKKEEQAEEIKTIVWFGYHHNLRALDPVVPMIKERDLELVVISDKPFNKADKNLPWTKETYLRDIVDHADVVLNPRLDWGKWKYKSDNKTVTAWALGVPVARTLEEFEALQTRDAREKEVEEKLKLVADRYHPRLSAIEYGKVILQSIEKKQIRKPQA